MNLFTRSRWSPYLVGALIGVLSWVTFASMGKALGTSTSMVQAVGAVERAVAPAHADGNAYLVKEIGSTDKPKPWFDWQFALVLLLPAGAWLAARQGGSRFVESVPELWRERFGDSRGKRWFAAFAGGAIMLFGARMAGGCTSGHGISGGLQLAVGSWVFIAALFAGGVATALALYHKKEGGHV